jgi:hypothetical protein
MHPAINPPGGDFPIPVTFDRGVVFSLPIQDTYDDIQSNMQRERYENLTLVFLFCEPTLLRA